MRKTIIKRVTSVLGIVIVIGVIVSAFLFKQQIEQCAMTGYIGVFVACFAATSTILLPAPGIFVVIQYAQFLNPLAVVLIGGLGTSLGEMIGYLLGRFGQEVIEVNRGNRILKWFNRNAYLTVFVFSLVPLPVFDVVGIAAGINKTNPLVFWLCCFAGKIIKMAIYVLMFDYVKDMIPVTIMK